ncbi:MAG: hypothetical protein J6S47_03985 [Eubacteriaceae bacterium]|nr:hypothetical protein [Eubacteriaceae bacterium]
MDTTMHVIKLPESDAFPICSVSGKDLVDQLYSGEGEVTGDALPERVILECPAEVTALAGRGKEIIGYTGGSYYVSPEDLSERTLVMFAKDTMTVPFVQKSMEYHDPDRPSYVNEFGFRALIYLEVDDPIELGKIIFGAGLADPEGGEDHYTDVIRRIISKSVMKVAAENLLIEDEACKNTVTYDEDDLLEEEDIHAGECGDPGEYIRCALEEQLKSAVASLDAGISIVGLEEPELDIPEDLGIYLRRLRDHRYPTYGTFGTIRMDDPSRRVVMLIPGTELTEDNYILDLTRDQIAMIVDSESASARHDEKSDLPVYVTSILEVPVLEWSRRGRREDHDLCIVDTSALISCEFNNCEILVYNDARDDYMGLTVDGTALAGVPRSPRDVSDMVDMLHRYGVNDFTDDSIRPFLSWVLRVVFDFGLRCDALFGENALRPWFVAGTIKMSADRTDRFGMFSRISGGVLEGGLTLKELSIRLREVKRPGDGSTLDALDLSTYKDRKDIRDERPLIKAVWELTRGSGGEAAENAVSYLERRSFYDPLAAVFLAHCYRDGIGVEKDRHKYIDLIYDAASDKMDIMKEMSSAAVTGRASLALNDSYVFRWKMPVFCEYLRHELDAHPDKKGYVDIEDDIIDPLRRAAMMDEPGWRDILREIWERGGQLREYILDYVAFEDGLKDPPAYREMCCELAKDSVDEHIQKRADREKDFENEVGSVTREEMDRMDFASSVVGKQTEYLKRVYEEEKREEEQKSPTEPVGRRSFFEALGHFLMTEELWASALCLLTIALLYLFRWFESDAAPDGILWAFVHMISTFGTFAVAAVALFFSFELLFEIGIIGGIIGAVGSVAVVILMGSYPYVLTYSVIGLGVMAAVMFIKTLIVMKRGY